MAIKLIVPAMDGLVDSLSTANISAAVESIWTRISDSIAYMFTSDSSMSEKIGNMCYWLEHMDEDQIEAIDNSKIDGKYQTYNNMNSIMQFSAAAVDFCVQNLPKYERKEYALNDAHRKAIEEEMESSCSTFEASHNRNVIAGFMDKNPDNVGEDPTLARLGFTHSKLTDFAKRFKNDQSGRLSKVRKLKFVSNITAYNPEGGKIKLVNVAARNFGVILNDAMKAYSYVDKFLFRVYREMKRQKIILH